MVQLELEPAFRMSSDLEYGYYSVDLSAIIVTCCTAMHLRRNVYNRACPALWLESDLSHVN